MSSGNTIRTTYRCADCGRTSPFADDNGRCDVCVSQAVDRAAMFDDFDRAVLGLLAAGVDELQLRRGLIMAIDDSEGPITGDFIYRARDEEGGFIYQVDSSFLAAGEDIGGDPAVGDRYDY